MSRNLNWGVLGLYLREQIDFTIILLLFSPFFDKISSYQIHITRTILDFYFVNIRNPVTIKE